ncbi:hypothetical protein EAF00_002182 [Botryotinia globosa]|nr:hypothetical protein EAF00_002182 [Botryotinia globosa]
MSLTNIELTSRLLSQSWLPFCFYSSRFPTPPPSCQHSVETADKHSSTAMSVTSLVDLFSQDWCCSVCYWILVYLRQQQQHTCSSDSKCSQFTFYKIAAAENCSRNCRSIVHKTLKPRSSPILKCAKKRQKLIAEQSAVVKSVVGSPGYIAFHKYFLTNYTKQCCLVENSRTPILPSELICSQSSSSMSLEYAISKSNFHVAVRFQRVP